MINYTYMTPSESGLHAGTLLRMLEELDEKAELHNIVIIKDGNIVLEGAWQPYTLEDPQMMHSLSKIGIAICIGFAIEEGKLKLEDRFLDYVRDELPKNYAPILETVTISDLLTMRAGSEKCANNVYFTALASDWAKTWLKEKRIPEDIGKVFHYDSGCSYTLSVIISRLMSKTCSELLWERVFSPIGLRKINWLISPEGYNTGGWGMYLTAREIAALGLLLLNQGVWNGERLLSQKWVEELQKARVVKPGMEERTLSHYGYHMHMGKNVYAVEGAFEQLLLCFREYPIAVAITAGTNNDHVADICEKYILEAVQKGASPQEEDALKRKAAALEVPFVRGTAGTEIPRPLLERWIVLSENPRGISRVQFKMLNDKLLRVQVQLSDGTFHTLRAGNGEWISNDVFNDYSKRYHCLAYTVRENALYLSDCMINTSYREEYMFLAQENSVCCGWKPNVTYLDGNANYQRNFSGSFSD